MKTRKISFAMLIALFTMMISSFFIPMETKAVWDDDNFNVSWDENGDNGGNVSVSGTNDMGGSFSKVINKYKTVITFISAIGAVTMVAIFIINFMKLGTTSGNPSERSKCITALVISGIAAAGLGSVALIVGVFYGMLADNDK